MYRNALLKNAVVFGSLILSCQQVFGAKLSIETPENIAIDFGARLHLLANTSDDDRLADREDIDFQVRRARLRFSATVDKWIIVGLQTETLAQLDKTGSDVAIIDAYVQLKPSEPLQFVLGQHMSPALRQNVTSSGAMLAIDRPAINYKSLTWGTRALSGFARRTESNTDTGLRGETDVRDVGATLFGAASSSESMHYTYYLGVYEGAQSAASNRFTGRFQLNLGDAENSYYNSSTYYGNKNTIAFGVSLDSQQDVALDSASSEEVNYALQSVDFFLEKPVGKTSVTFETAYINLDLDGASYLANQKGNAFSGKAQGLESEGSGYYLQGGWKINQWQPWIGFEDWTSNSDNDAGSFQNFRVGLTYIVNKFTNFKAGIEYWDDKSATEDFYTFTSGIFITF